MADHVVFLDVPNDRYFCLGEAASKAFLTLTPNYDSPRPEPPLEKLINAGIIYPTDGAEMPRSCSAPPVKGTLADRRSGKASVAEAWEALCRRLQAEIGLRLFGLERMLGAAAASRAHTVRFAPEVAAQASSAFAAASLWRTRQRSCLSISLATMHWLLRRRAQAQLVLGVKLHPFQAHCWVQSEGFLINDDPDLVRNFTPILVV